MAVVRMDEKGRIQVPSEVRRSWHLAPRQALELSVERDSMVVRKPRPLDPKTDPLLRDIMERPLRLPKGVRLTKKLLRKLKDEAWTP